MSGLGVSDEIALEKHYPLHKACRDGNQDIVSALLLGKQHDLYEEDGYFGWTPTHWASYFGKLSCLMTLLEHGCSCDSVTHRFNQSPLHIAALGGNGHCIKWLIHCGAALNRQDYLGDTPVHKAARAGSMECVSLLVSQNASIDIRNYNGQTASEVALTSSHVHCSEYLQQALQLQQNGHLDSAQLMQTNPLNEHNIINGHINERNSEDCDMDFDTSHDIQHDQFAMENSCHGGVEMNGLPIDGRGDNGSSVFRAFAGVKRSLDDEDEDQIKRRCLRDQDCEETALNNNVLSSYNSILAISSLPAKSLPNTGNRVSMADLNSNNGTEANRMQDNLITPCHNRQMNYLPCELQNYAKSTKDDYHPGFHIDPKVPPVTMSTSDPISQSAVEHDSSIQEQHGYNNLLAASFIYHQK